LLARGEPRSGESRHYGRWQSRPGSVAQLPKEDGAPLALGRSLGSQQVGVVPQTLRAGEADTVFLVVRATLGWVELER